MVWQKGKIFNFILTRLAKSQGFLDPVLLFSRLQRFAKPAEVWVPTELLRSGSILQARGLINSQAIQHNLDWVWPYWVNHQFDPKGKAFIPRAFNVSHINMTNRNWTAIGIPDFANYPIVDPRGLITPFWDSWSVDAWIMDSEHTLLFPSQVINARQKVEYNCDFKIVTTSKLKEATLISQANVEMVSGIPTCKIVFTGNVPYKAWLVICLRPYNPEGVSFVNDIKKLTDSEGWKVNEDHDVHLSHKPWHYMYSNYHQGDISQQILLSVVGEPKDDKEIHCPVGMAASAALYEVKPYESKEITVNIPLSKHPVKTVTSWAENLEEHCQLCVPDKLFQFLYEVNLRALILHSPGDIFPGPFTYKKFWFRDAAFILNAMLTLGISKNVEKILDLFPERQMPSGYFRSQDGEWDSNGQALWIMQRFGALTNKPVKPEWFIALSRGAKWIQKKRVHPKEKAPHSGLLPAGFSAEHFGPNDYYYWDDFWGVAGLKSAAAALKIYDEELSRNLEIEADDLLKCIEESLNLVKARINDVAMPASPYRRMDGGAIGSIVASYPLQIWPGDDPRILSTAKYLFKKCFLNGAFYHEISHSGLNAYLTLHVAQVLLRAGNSEFFQIVNAVAELASPTGQWPEAIHPQTLGGCMGDGQHIWASAEWVLMIRNMFVREEENSKAVILCSGIPEGWLLDQNVIYFGYTLTVYGKIAVTITYGEKIRVSWDAQWYGEVPRIEVHFPGYLKRIARANESFIEIKKDERLKDAEVFKIATIAHNTEERV